MGTFRRSQDAEAREIPICAKKAKREKRRGETKEARNGIAVGEMGRKKNGRAEYRERGESGFLYFFSFF